MWGYHLELGACGRCEKPLTEPAADFSPESGTFLCKDCLGIASPRAKKETLDGFWALHRNLPFQDFQYTENALISYLRNHIGFLKEIHSLQWLQEIRKLCSTPKT
jgi:DNA repair protein RecO (recombination protein O)